MGGKRRSSEELIIEFFQSAPSDAIASIFKVVQAIVRNRCPKVPKSGVKKKVNKKSDERQATIPATVAPKEDLPF